MPKLSEKVKQLHTRLQKDLDKINKEISETNNKEVQSALHKVLELVNNAANEIRSLSTEVEGIEPVETEFEVKKEEKTPGTTEPFTSQPEKKEENKSFGSGLRRPQE